MDQVFQSQNKLVRVKKKINCVIGSEKELRKDKMKKC